MVISLHTLFVPTGRLRQPASQPSQALDRAGARRVDLDWLRIGAFGLLILYHVGMCYATWDWHDAVKSRHASQAIEPLLMLTVPWRMSLLFVVSGAVTGLMAARMSPARLARGRLRRLLPPLALGVLLVVPPQLYVQVVQQMHFADGYLAFWQRYLAADPDFCWGGRCLIVPTYNHLWFVAYLLGYTLLLAAATAVLGARLGSIARFLERGLLAGQGLGVVVWPWLLLAGLRIALIDRFPPNYAFVGDWHSHASYLAVFLFGFLLLRSDAVCSAIERHRWLALALAAAAYGLLVRDSATHPDAASAQVALPWLRHAAVTLDQWAAIVAILGFGRRLLRHDGPVRRYLTDAVFPYYIVHQTAIVLAVHHLRPLELPVGSEAAFVLAVTVATCGFTYELVRRVDWLRPWFGLGRRDAQPGL